MIKDVERTLQTPNVVADYKVISLGTASWRLGSYLFAFLYVLAFHYSYITYINPVFEYAHYYYISFSDTALLSTYLLTLLPIVAYRPSLHPAQALAALLYTLAYVPIQLSLLFSVNVTYSQLVETQAMLALSMAVIFCSAKSSKKCRPLSTLNFRSMDRFVGIAASISLIILLTNHIDHMRVVSFDDVYDLRYEASLATTNVISAYLTSWLSYCFISYFYARGIACRKWSMLLVGFVSSSLLYATTGSKAAILLLPVTIGLGWLWGSGKAFLPKLLATTVLFLGILTAMVPDEGIGIWIKSIVLVRVLGTVGWVASKYYEYFGSEGLTYYSHIGPLNSLTDMYEYGNLSLGQVIGLAYSGSSEANFNAGFWASDGFAALGPIGVLVVTPFIALLLQIINRCMGKFDTRFSLIWLLGFFIALFNVPLSTALLSGGGIVILAQAWWISSSAHQSHKNLTSNSFANVSKACWSKK